MQRILVLLVALVMALTVLAGTDAEAHEIRTCRHGGLFTLDDWHITHVRFVDHFTKLSEDLEHVHEYKERHGWWDEWETYYVTCGKYGMPHW